MELAGAGADCLCLGLAVADHLCSPIARMPDAGELAISDRLELAVGGCAANVAVDLVRNGCTAGIAGCVGDDLFGAFVRGELERAGVCTDKLRVTRTAPTSGTLIVNVRGEDRRFIHAIGANGEIDGTEIDDADWTRHRVLYVGGYFAMPRFSPGGLAQMLSAARGAGCATVVDVVLPGHIHAAAYRAALEEFLPHCDVFLPNTEEAARLTGLSSPHEQAAALRDLGARTVIVTCGGQGCVIASDEGLVRASAFPVEFVDGTGSGDAFDAGYIAGLLQGESTWECVARGSALGASCVQATGATSGVFTAEQTEEFLRSHRLEFTRIV